MSWEESTRPEEIAKRQAVYLGLRGLLNKRMAILPPDVARLVSVVTFAFYSDEAPVSVVEISHPAREEAIEVAFSSHIPNRKAQFVLESTGDMHLESAYADAAALSSAYAPPHSPFGSELGNDFVNNFDFYYAILEGSRATALVELSHPPQNSASS